MTFFSLTKYNDNPPTIWLYTNPWHFYRTRPFIELWEVSIEHLLRMWHADRACLLILTPDPVPFGTCICCTCWDQSFLSSFSRTMLFEHPLVLSRICLTLYFHNVPFIRWYKGWHFYFLLRKTLPHIILLLEWSVWKCFYVILSKFLHLYHFIKCIHVPYKNCWNIVCNLLYYIRKVTFQAKAILMIWFWWYFVPKCVKRNLSPGLLRWSSLQTKEGQRHTEFHLVGFENS